MKIDPQQIPFVKPGQPITAQQYNDLLAAVRASAVRPSADHMVSRTSAGTLINNKGGNSSSSSAFNHAFKVTEELDPSLTDPDEIADNIHLRVEAGALTIIGGDTDSSDACYLQIPRDASYNSFYVAARYVFNSNYTDGTWYLDSGKLVHVIDTTTYLSGGTGWEEYDTDGFLIARNFIIATVTLDGSSPNKVLSPLVQHQVGDIRTYDVFINTHSFG